jgi:3-oxoacyl-[acyl-carrier protein] reductase
MKILITGASRGIGKALAEAFYTKKNEVYGIGSSFDPNLPILNEYFQVDLTNQQQIQDLSNHISNNYQFDVLINNAGINIINNFCDISSENWQKQHMINVFAPFKLSQAVIPSMKLHGFGRIVNIASVWSKISKPGRAAYSATKFALEGMTKSVASEFAKDNILVNCVSPGFINTDLTKKNLDEDGIKKILERVPIGRMAECSELISLTIWLASNENTYMTGQNLIIDGGFTCA